MRNEARFRNRPLMTRIERIYTDPIQAVYRSSHNLLTMKESTGLAGQVMDEASLRIQGLRARFQLDGA